MVIKVHQQEGGIFGPLFSNYRTPMWSCDCSVSISYDRDHVVSWSMSTSKNIFTICCPHLAGEYLITNLIIYPKYFGAESHPTNYLFQCWQQFCFAFVRKLCRLELNASAIILTWKICKMCCQYVVYSSLKTRTRTHPCRVMLNVATLHCYHRKS